MKDTNHKTKGECCTKCYHSMGEDICEDPQCECHTGDFIEEKISSAVNSFISVKDNGEEYMTSEDILNLKKHLTSLAHSIREQTIDEVALFPEHKASLHLTHNQHKAYYEPIEEYIAEKEENVGIDWATPTSKEEAIKNDSLWELQWYPNTPVGFNLLFASNLSDLLSSLRSKKDDE